MVNPTPSRLNVLRTRKLRAEKALRAARYQVLRARTQLIGSTGAAAVARRVVVELAQRELDQAIAEVAAAAEALDAVDARQMPLAAWSRTAPPRPDGAGTGGASAWGRAHGLGAP